MGSLFAQCNDELVNICALDIGEATYLKDFKVRLKKAKKGKPAPVARYSVVLNKGTHYRFSVCNAQEFEGEAILQLYDNDKLIGSTFNVATGKTYKAFDFICRKSAVYHLFFSYKEGKEGCSVGILSFVTRQDTY
ncbi:MAG: hypothetical protein C0594_01905 [Marinilabiliales bacterium]|nr:MAG: hypothetical protein C0594_01905 [Marinilabiliales bacterium]